MGKIYITNKNLFFFAIPFLSLLNIKKGTNTLSLSMEEYFLFISSFSLSLQIMKKSTVLQCLVYLSQVLAVLSQGTDEALDLQGKPCPGLQTVKLTATCQSENMTVALSTRSIPTYFFPYLYERIQNKGNIFALHLYAGKIWPKKYRWNQNLSKNHIALSFREFTEMYDAIVQEFYRQLEIIEIIVT